MAVEVGHRGQIGVANDDERGEQPLPGVGVQLVFGQPGGATQASQAQQTRNAVSPLFRGFLGSYPIRRRWWP